MCCKIIYEKTWQVVQFMNKIGNSTSSTDANVHNVRNLAYIFSLSTTCHAITNSETCDCFSFCGMKIFMNGWLGLVVVFCICLCKALKVSFQIWQSQVHCVYCTISFAVFPLYFFKYFFSIFSHNEHLALMYFVSSFGSISKTKLSCKYSGQFSTEFCTHYRQMVGQYGSRRIMSLSPGKQIMFLNSVSADLF